MGATYTRQSSYTDGDVITAAHTNDEFNQLLAAFASSTGHTHDGTAAEGGAITKLLGNTLTFGAGTAGTDITITFDGETSDGVLLWKEDEDYFEFSDDILIASTEKLQFRDTAIYINSSADGQLDLVADTEIQLAATTVDLNGNLDVSGSITLGGTAITSTAAELNILDGVTSTATELNALDGITSTVTELNILDGDTSASSVTVADADRVVLNDGGTMKQVAVTDLSAYFDDEITAMPNLVTTAATTVGALNSGSITSGFGTINTGSSTITTTGLITGGSLDIDDVVINGATIGHTDDTDLITLASGSVTIAGDLTVSGDDITMGTNTSGNLLIADGTNFNSVAVGSLSEISTVANDDVFLAVDTSGGGLKKVTRSTIVSGLAVGGVALSNIVEDTTPQLGGSLDVNGQDIVSVSNGNITLTPNGTGVVRVDGSSGIDMQSGGISIKNSGSESYVRFYCESSNAHYSQLQASPHSAYSGNVTLVLPASADTLVGRATTDTLTNKTLTSPVISTVTGSTITLDSEGDITLDADGADVVLKDGGTTFGSMTNSSGELVIKSGSTPTAAMTFSGANVTLEGNLTVSGTTTTVNSTTVNLNDHNIVLDSGNSTSAVVNGAGITIEGGSGDDATFSYNTTGPKFELKLGSSHEDLQVDQLIAASLDISGNVDVDGTLETDALSINGTTVTSTAAELNILDGVTSTASELNILDGVTSTATELNLVDGSSAGTIANSKAVIYGSSGEVNATTLQIAGTSITSTAAELNILDGVTSTATELNIMDGNTSASSTTLVDADRVVTNDNGTMKQVALTDVKTYLTSAGFTSDDPTALAIALG
jgi:hypothetical protein